jgi:hypothetical protein
MGRKKSPAKHTYGKTRHTKKNYRATIKRTSIRGSGTKHKTIPIHDSKVKIKIIY